MKWFKEVFGDDLDEDQMKKTIDGLLKDNKDLVEKMLKDDGETETGYPGVNKEHGYIGQGIQKNTNQDQRHSQLGTNICNGNYFGHAITWRFI